MNTHSQTCVTTPKALLAAIVLLGFFWGAWPLAAQADSAEAPKKAADSTAAEQPPTDTNGNAKPQPEQPEQPEQQSESPKLEAKYSTLWLRPHLKLEAKPYLAGSNVAKDKDLGFWGEAQLELGADYNGLAGLYFKLKAQEFDQMTEAKEPLYIDDLNFWLKPLGLFAVRLSWLDLLFKGGLTNISANNAQHASFDNWKADSHELDKAARGKGLVPSMQLDLIFWQMLTLRLGTRLADYDDGAAGGSLAHDVLLGLLLDKSFGPHKILASVSWVADLSDDTQYIGNDDQDFDELGLTAAYTLNLDTIELTPFVNLLLRTVFTGGADNSYGQGQRGFKWSGGLKFSFRPQGITYLYAGVDLGGESRPGLSAYDGKYQAFKDLGLTLATDALKKFMGPRFLSFWAKLHLAFDEPYKADVGRFARVSPLEQLEIGLNQRILIADGIYIGALLIYEIANTNQYYDTITKNRVDSKGENPNVGLDHTIKFQVEMNFKHSWKRKL